jgi:valyl-tRNA synthetase
MNPIMPFVTEHLWRGFSGVIQTLNEKEWPKEVYLFDEAAKSIDFLIHMVDEVRSLKGLLGIQGGTKVPLVSVPSNADHAALQSHWSWVSHLARLSHLESSGSGVPFVVGDNSFTLVMEEGFNLDDAKKLLMDKAAVLMKECEHLSKKLQNEAFKLAKPDLFEHDADLLLIKQAEERKIQAVLAHLKKAS